MRGSGGDGGEGGGGEESGAAPGGGRRGGTAPGQACEAVQARPLACLGEGGGSEDEDEAKDADALEVNEDAVNKLGEREDMRRECVCGAGLGDFFRARRLMGKRGEARRRESGKEVSDGCVVKAARPHKKVVERGREDGELVRSGLGTARGGGELGSASAARGGTLRGGDDEVELPEEAVVPGRQVAPLEALEQELRAERLLEGLAEPGLVEGAGLPDAVQADDEHDPGLRTSLTGATPLWYLLFIETLEG